MVAVIVPNLKIHLHVLSGHDAEAVHVELVEEGGAGLFEVQRHGLDDVFLNRFFDFAVESQSGETIIVGDETREIDIRGKFLVKRFHANVGVGIGQHVDGEG